MKVIRDIKLAREIIRIRLCQLIINEKYKNGEFSVPIHLALGHEAIAVAVAKNMRAEDVLVVSHRNIHYNLARIKTLKSQLDEYLLRDNGLGKACFGSMNLANPRQGIVYASSILGNNLGVAAGIAMAHKIKRSKGIVFVVTGDGAMEEGGFYEALEFLGSHDLACMVIVENNEWSLATKICERRCNIDLKKLSSAFDIRFEQLAGNDVYEYTDTIRGLRQHAVKQVKPICLEVHLSTLGSWHQKTAACPEGRYINYHAGPAPTTSLGDWPVLEESKADPVYALCQYFDQARLKGISRNLLKFLEAGIQ